MKVKLSEETTPFLAVEDILLAIVDCDCKFSIIILSWINTRNVLEIYCLSLLIVHVVQF